MDTVTKEQVRLYRLKAHHLDKHYHAVDVLAAVGACGMQNSPPGAWEDALHQRIPGLALSDMRQMLESSKTLLQAWSIRGVPLVFPTVESDAFLSALVSDGDESWIYTRGITLALYYLQMSFSELLPLVAKALTQLDDLVVKTKTTLDQTLADWVAPLLPEGKRGLWQSPSMYGNPEKQTVGGAVVSFMLRPCSFLGLVVFGQREGTSPTFCSYLGWVGKPLEPADDSAQRLLRKYLHCYGPASSAGFADWLGASPEQAKRIWHSAGDEMEPVNVNNKQLFIHNVDKPALLNPSQPERQLHLLSGHDPYLGLQDRDVILADKARQRQAWQTVSNPGVVLWRGEIVGLWKPKKSGKSLDIDVDLWDAETAVWGDTPALKAQIDESLSEYAAFRQLRLRRVSY